MLIKDIYNPDIFPLDEAIHVKEALGILISKHYNGALVLNAKGKLKGVLSIQDIAAAIVPEDMRENISLAQAMYKPNFFSEMCQEIAGKPIKEIMRRDFITADPDTSVMEVAAEFLKNDLYIVPVCDDGKSIGIVTRSEIKKALAVGMDIHIK